MTYDRRRADTSTYWSSAIVATSTRRPDAPQASDTRSTSEIIAAYLQNSDDSDEADLRYGAAKKDSPRLTAQVESVLDAIDTLPFDSPADEIYGSLNTSAAISDSIGGRVDLKLLTAFPCRWCAQLSIWSTRIAWLQPCSAA
jgi:hypothetical protein